MSTKIRILVFVTMLMFLSGGITPNQATNRSYQNRYVFSEPGIENGDLVDYGNPSSLSSDLQYTASGHVLRFDSASITLAAADHALSIEFVGANPVEPIAAQLHANQYASENELGGSPFSPQTKPLGKVKYPQLWEGVTLEYQHSHQGILESTYWIEPPIQEHVEQIHLRYNTWIELFPEGSLATKFATGQMLETAPVAWQEVNGARASVQVVFHQLGERDAGFVLQGEYDPTLPLVIDPLFMWASFLGASGHDSGNDIEVDGLGNVYLVGTGTNPSAGDHDAFVAKLDSSGSLVWNTFLGSTDFDEGTSIDLDGLGNIYISGSSTAAWGGLLTVNPHSTGIYYDAFAAKLNSSGTLLWNTFLGSKISDHATSIVVDGVGNVYLGGHSNETWGASPINAYVGEADGFCAKLNNSGVLQWNTFLGSDNYDDVTDIALYGSGGDLVIYLSGISESDWGTPGSFVGGVDAFIAQLDYSGVRQWNLFVGSTDTDQGYGVGVDNSGNPYLIGHSADTWGSPLNPHSGSEDIFVVKIASSGSLKWNTFIESYSISQSKIAIDGSTGDIFVSGGAGHSWGSPVNPGGYADGQLVKLNSSGVKQWHTFMGSDTWDYVSGIAFRSGSVYLAGSSNKTWGSPVKPFTTGPDAFAAKLNASDGVRQWNTFFGSKGEDYGRAIALDASGNIYIAGYSVVSWGTPVNAYSGGSEAFVAKLNNNGTVNWSTFLGSASDDYAFGIAVYGSNVYVVGSSDAVWGTGTHHGGWDAFVAKLNASTGARQWNVFLGSDGEDEGNAVSADASGVYVTGFLTELGSGSEILVARLNGSGGIIWSTNYGSSINDVGFSIVTDASDKVYIAGMSSGSWGDPVNDYNASIDAVVAAFLKSDGSLQWNTFLGSSYIDFAAGIDVDESGNIYLAGAGFDSWGDPVNAYTDGLDAFAASLDEEGNLRWNTFMGSSEVDQGFAVCVDSPGKTVYVAGYSEADWGSPVFPYISDADAFVAKIGGSDGVRKWNAFLGSEWDDEARGIAVANSGRIYVAGSSREGWDIDWTLEKDWYEGSWDAFVARIVSFELYLPIVRR